MRAAANADLSWPSEVPYSNDCEPFWGAILSRRGASEWTREELLQAAELARDMAHLVREKTLLIEEGTVVLTAGGNPMKNPRESVVHGLKASIMAQRQKLGLHDAGKGDKRDVRKRRELAKKIEASNPLDDDLLMGRSTTIQ